MGNLNEVSKEMFFFALNRDNRDIMPTIVGKDLNQEYIQEWRTNDSTRSLFGKTVAHNYWILGGGII